MNFLGDPVEAPGHADGEDEAGGGGHLQVQRCRGAEVQRGAERCRVAGEEVHRCTCDQVHSCNAAELHR